MTNTLLTVGVLILIIGGVVFMIQDEPQKNSVPLTTETPVTDSQVNTTTDTDSAINKNTETPTVVSIKTLDISNQGLGKVPMDIFTKTDIEELNVSNNKLEGSLQGEVRFLQNLKVLNLSNNNFTGLPAEIGQLKNLEVLNVSNNSLTGLPNELGNLSNLKVLNLKGNDYSTSDLSNIQLKLPKTVVIETD